MTPPSRHLVLSPEEDAALRSLELSAGIHVKVRLRASIVRLNASGMAVPRLAGEGPWDHASGLADAAIGLAARAHAGAIVAVTREGRTARLLSSGRPTAPIYAATDRPEVARRLALWWGVAPLVVSLEGDVDAVGGRVVDQLRGIGALSASPTVVIVNVSPDLDLGAANFVRIRRA